MPKLSAFIVRRPLTLRSFAMLVGASALVATVVAYANAWRVPFQFDDNSMIVQNGELAHPHLDALMHIYAFRVLPFLSFAANYRFGGLQVTGYHAVNLAIHLANTVLVVVMCLQLARLAGLPSLRARLLLSFVPLAFALHPLQTEAVTYIWQRVTLLVTFCCLLSIIFYLAYVRRRQAGVAGRSWLFLSSLAFLVGLFSKENSLTLIPIVGAIEVVFGAKEGLTVGSRLKSMLIWAIPVICVPLVWGIYGNTSLQHVRDLPGGALSPYVYFLTQLGVHLRYFGLVIYPIGQSIDHDYPVYRSLAAAAPCLAFAIFAGLLLAAWRARGREPLVLFGALFYLAAMALESSLVPMTDIAYEHRLYFPSLGLFLVLSCLMGILAERSVARIESPRAVGWLCAVVVTGAALLMAYLTSARNEVWRSPIALWQDSAETSPHKFRSLNNLAASLRDAGRLDEAQQWTRRAHKASPQRPEPFQIMATISLKKGDSGAYLRWLRKYCHRAPRDISAHFELAGALAGMGLAAEAAGILREVLQVTPENVWALNGLGVLYTRIGRFDEAVKVLEGALRAEPGELEVEKNLANAEQMQAKVGHFPSTTGPQ